jgi:hypothetical protein
MDTADTLHAVCFARAACDDMTSKSVLQPSLRSRRPLCNNKSSLFDPHKRGYKQQAV